MLLLFCLFQAGDFSVGSGFIDVTVAVAPHAVTLIVDEAPVTSSVLRVKLVIGIILVTVIVVEIEIIVLFKIKFYFDRD
jgi:hypothetical protein